MPAANKRTKPKSKARIMHKKPSCTIIFGITCELTSLRAIDQLKKLLSRIKKNHADDFDKICTTVKFIKKVSKEDIEKTGELGSWVENESTVYFRQTLKNPDRILTTFAHEFGHVCATDDDIEDRKAPHPEWASEAAADMYVAKWGYLKMALRVWKKYQRNQDHHGPLPGETCEYEGMGAEAEIFSTVYLVDKNFIYHSTPPKK